MKNKALVVIDIQNDITKSYREIIGNINAAVERAAANGIHVVYIKHNNLTAGTRTFKPGTRGEELVPEMKIVSGNIFTKTKGNALTSEAFSAFIAENAVSEFYIAGADAAVCVKSTCCRTASPATTGGISTQCSATTKAKVAQWKNSAMFRILRRLPRKYRSKNDGRNYCAVRFRKKKAAFEQRQNPHDRNGSRPPPRQKLLLHRRRNNNNRKRAQFYNHHGAPEKIIKSRRN